MTESTKLVIFMAGFICLLMSVSVSWVCIIPAAWFWALLYLLNWFLADWPIPVDYSGVPGNGD
jgi:hypothetical protein